MIDRKTRGRTAPHRLRALDAYLLHAERALLSPAHGDAAFIDVGFGEHPWTTLATAAALRTAHPKLTVIGLERDPSRASAAVLHDDSHTRFLHGGFDALSLLAPARIVRAMNVLRTYPEEEARQAHALLGAPLIDQGLLLEGSSDPGGALLTCHLLRRSGPQLLREGLLFFTDFSKGFAPIAFRDWLPRDLRRRVTPGEWIRGFFDQWTEAWQAVRSADPRSAFISSLARLSQRLPGVDATLAHAGLLILRPPGGVPR